MYNIIINGANTWIFTTVCVSKMSLWRIYRVTKARSEINFYRESRLHRTRINIKIILPEDVCRRFGAVTQLAHYTKPWSCSNMEVGSPRDFRYCFCNNGTWLEGRSGYRFSYFRNVRVTCIVATFKLNSLTTVKQGIVLICTWFSLLIQWITGQVRSLNSIKAFKIIALDLH